MLNAPFTFAKAKEVLSQRTRQVLEMRRMTCAAREVILFVMAFTCRGSSYVALEERV